MWEGRPLSPLTPEERGKEPGLHPEMRLPCVSNRGGRGGEGWDLCFEAPEPEGRGLGVEGVMLIALCLSLGRRAAASSGSQVCKLSLLAWGRGAMKSN